MTPEEDKSQGDADIVSLDQFPEDLRGLTLLRGCLSRRHRMRPCTGLNSIL